MSVTFFPPSAAAWGMEGSFSTLNDAVLSCAAAQSAKKEQKRRRIYFFMNWKRFIRGERKWLPWFKHSFGIFAVKGTDFSVNGAKASVFPCKKHKTPVPSCKSGRYVLLLQSDLKSVFFVVYYGFQPIFNQVGAPT